MQLILLFTLINFKYSNKDFTTWDKNPPDNFGISNTFSSNKYSDNKYEGISSTIFINEEHESDHIMNSQFINPNLSNNQQYLFVVQKEFVFENVFFSFLETYKNNIGAIKIETNDQIIIRNCTFITNSNNRADNAIFISPHPKNERKGKRENFNTFLIEKNIFLNFNTAISAFSERITIIDNDIIYCKRNAIYIANQFSSQNNFDLINNRIRNCNSNILIEINGQLTQNPKIQGNIFENCNDVSCVFSLSLSDFITEILFENNTFRNFRNLNKFVDFNSKSSHFDVTFFNCHFIDNVKSSSENGGGIEILFNGPEKVAFDSCQFLNNSASEKIERNTISEHQNDEIIFVDFINCLFKNNEAFGKGGAIFIQKVQNLVILNCSFNFNKVNQRLNKTCKKGRGGAIYYKSTLSPKGQFSNVQISDCTFTSNSAFDGFSLYIEYEDKIQNFLTFSLNKNTFSNNYQNDDIENDTHKNDRAVITTEFTQIIEKENKFIENHSKHFSHVDFKGNPISRRLKQDYSYGEFNGEVGPIYINDQFTESSIVSSLFQMFSVSNENYLFIVQKEFTFRNVEFNLSPTIQQFGAIKIECTESVTILNCTFRYCSVSNDEFASVIHSNVSDYVEINNCIFLNCGSNSKRKMISFNESRCFELNNSLFNDCKGIINIQINGNINIKNNNFTNNLGYINITDTITTNNIVDFNLYNNRFTNLLSSEATIIFHSFYVISDIKIDNCNFFNCTGSCCCYFNIQKLIETNINVSLCSFKNSIYNISGLIVFNNKADSIDLLIESCVFDNNCLSYTSIISLDTFNDDSLLKNIQIRNCMFNGNLDSPGLAIIIKQFNANLKILNCTFARYCISHTYDKPWANTISVDRISQVNISNCIFEGGGVLNSGNVIGILGLKDTKCMIQDCFFNYTSAAISTYVEGTTIYRNIFNKCDRNTFRLSSETGSKGFELINNTFDQRVAGVIINIWSYGLKYKPIISGNVFKNAFIERDYYYQELEERNFFNLQIASKFSLILENNKFINFHSVYTGLMMNINHVSKSTFNFRFTNCTFTNNTSDEKGGSFGCPDSKNYETFELYFSNCIFENNTAKENGGALHIKTGCSIKIINCTFLNNHVSDGNGGAIFIEGVKRNLTIESCLFNDNSAFEGNALYVNNSVSKFMFKQNVFLNNINKTKSTTEDQFMIVFDLKSVELVDVNFDSTKNWKIYPILFLSSELSNIYLTRVNSLYSSLLYFSTKISKPLSFRNFAFKNCNCKNHLIDINCDSNAINFNATLYNVTFNKCQSNQGAIYTSPNFYLVLFTSCNFASCFGDNFSCFNLQCKNPILFDDVKIMNCLYNHNLGEINIITNSNKITQVIQSCYFYNNTKISKESVQNSGILFNSNSPLFVISFDHCTFNDNSASANYGGSNCFCKHGSNNKIELNIYNCEFSRNLAGVDGGALFISNIDTFSITDTQLRQNYCQGCGGAISLYYESQLTSTVPPCCRIENCNFEYNCAKIYGNSLFLNDFRQDVNFSFTNNIFSNNYCDQDEVGFVIVSRKEGIDVDSNDFKNDDESIAVNPIYYINITKDLSPSQDITPTIEITETIEITQQTNEVISIEDTKSIEITKSFEITKSIEITKSFDNTNLIDVTNSDVDYSIIQSSESNSESDNVVMKSKGKKKKNLLKLILYLLILAFEIIMIILIIIIFVLIKKRMNNYEIVESFTDDSL